LPVERGKGAVFGSDLQRFPDPATERMYCLSNPAYSTYLPAYYGRVTLAQRAVSHLLGATAPAHRLSVN
jgi:hypothetical protein